MTLRLMGLLACLASLAPSAALAEEPKLEHHSPALLEGKDLEVTARLGSAQDVLGVVFWRLKGDTAYEKIQMAQEGTTLTATIPGARVHSDLECYLDVF